MYDRILVPTDGSEVAGHAVEHAIHIAQQNDAVLHVIHVVDPDTLPSSVSSIRIEEELSEMGEDILDDVRERAEDAGLDVETELLVGPAHGEILDYADEHDIDLIVMGTHGRSGINRMLLGSVTERVVRAAHAPVLTVHLGEEGDREPADGTLD